jgi:hypothetical protein
MWPIVSQHTFDTLTQRRNLGLWSIIDLLRAATAFAGLATCTAHLSLAPYGSIRVYTAPYGYIRLHTGLYGYIRVYTAPVYTGPYVKKAIVWSVWTRYTRMEPYGAVWSRFNTYGAYGAVWSRMEPYGAVSIT